MKRPSAKRLEREIAAFLARCTNGRCGHQQHRSAKPTRYHEAKPTGVRSKRWDHKSVARRYNVSEDIVRRIYGAIQLAKKQGLHGGYMIDLIERSIGRKPKNGEYEVATLAKEHLGYDLPTGYQGPKPTGAAAEPSRVSSCDRRYREAERIRDAATRVIRDVMGRTGRIGTNEDKCLERLRHAADELDVAADLYEDAGATVLAGTVHEWARQARSGEYRRLSHYGGLLI